VASLDFGLAVGPTHPLDLQRLGRISHECDDVLRPAEAAAIAADLTAPDRHGELRSSRIPCSAVGTAQRGRIAPADGQFAMVRLAPAPDGGGVADGAVPAARAGSSPTALRPAKADER
jgi:hypothetical protein